MMEGWMTLILGVAGAALLCFGADWLVRGGVALARAAKVPSLVIGLTVVAFGTSAPELVVSVDAAWRGAGDISVGNVVGSNICNIALILGLSAMIRPLPVNRALFRLDLPTMFFSSVLLALWCVCSGGIGRIGGAAFCVLLLVYLVRRLCDARRDANDAKALAAEAAEGDVMPWYKAAPLTVVAILVLALGAKLFVDGAVCAARLLRVSEAVIGLTVVALGTSLPELATSVAAALRGRCDIAVGNVVGSNLFNVLGILGIAPLVSPIVAHDINYFDFGMMVGCGIMLWLMMRSGRIISRREGGVLLALYVLYIAKLAFWPQWGS